MERYINPFTDFGFKKLFGEEANKDLLIDFLNELLGHEAGIITDLTYLRNEHLGSAQEDRRAIFDLYCKNERGEHFIVELQKARQKFFKDRSLYYSTFAIQEQAQPGEWNFQLNRVYTVSIMDFVFHDEDEPDPAKFIHDIGLYDSQTHKLFNDKLRYIYIEMPRFNKREENLTTRFEKWLFVLKNLAALQNVPARLQERIFRRVFEIAELARFNPDDRRAYHDSLKYYRDVKNVVDTARDEGAQLGFELGFEEGLKDGFQKGEQEGFQKGEQEGFQKGEYTNALAIARRMKAKGSSVADIADVTNLPPDVIEQL
jgi:predicted transposase/invertase (TIGR01784 family)